MSAAASATAATPEKHSAGGTSTAAMDLNARRELRVVLPAETHRKLRSLKMLRGMSLGDCVTEALEQYFDERPELRRLLGPLPGPTSE